MDFITHFPKTSLGNDTILVIVDRLTKMTHFLACKSTDSAEDTAKHFLKVVALHGLPKSTVSDRDSKFTGSFWKSLLLKLQMTPLMSSAFHPQTDGQTERMNRTLEQYLRNYISFEQRNWEELLPIAEFAINNYVSASTKFHPFISTMDMILI